MEIGQGVLYFVPRYWIIYDGNTFYRVFSLALLFRMAFGKRWKRRIDGKWIVIGDVIVWFKKEKFLHHHFKIGETYHREMIKKG